MGTLLGHALPGSFFLLFSIWRTFQICYRLRLVEILSRTTNKTPVTFFTSAAYPCCLAWFSRWPVEGALKILVTSIGMGGELYASTDYGRAGKIRWMGDIQHVTMYSFFCLSGIVDVLRWKEVRFCPPGVDFLALANAFVGEWILFSHHLHGRTSLDVLLHTLLLYVIAINVLTIIAEYAFDKSLIAALATCYLLFVHGTWFIQVGVILYVLSPSTAWLNELSEGEQTIVATMIFAWHLGLAFISLSMLFLFFQYILGFSFQPKRLDTWTELLVSTSPSSHNSSSDHNDGAHLHSSMECTDSDATETTEDVLGNGATSNQKL